MQDCPYVYLYEYAYEQVRFCKGFYMGTFSVLFGGILVGLDNGAYSLVYTV